MNFSDETLDEQYLKRLEHERDQARDMNRRLTNGLTTTSENNARLLEANAELREIVTAYIESLETLARIEGKSVPAGELIQRARAALEKK